MNPVRRNSDPVRDPKDKSSNEARTSPQSTGWPSPDGQAHNGVNEQNLEVSIVAPCFNEFGSFAFVKTLAKPRHLAPASLTHKEKLLSRLTRTYKTTLRIYLCSLPNSTKVSMSQAAGEKKDTIMPSPDYCLPKSLTG